MSIRARPAYSISEVLQDEEPTVLHPKQFKVDEAWIAFELNDAPIPAGSDGSFNVLALMDAASCFVLSSALVSASAAEPSTMEARRLLEDGQAHNGQLPKTLFMPTDQPANELAVEAERQGITVVRVPEDQLLAFIGEAREGFRERFGGGSLQ
jgi:hypothetical protein